MPSTVEARKSSQASYGASAMRVRQMRMGIAKKSTSGGPDRPIRKGLRVVGSLMRRASSARNSTR
eukprot:scaffold31455_cov112-Isochrysis_galbana.AAC.1